MGFVNQAYRRVFTTAVHTLLAGQSGLRRTPKGASWFVGAARSAVCASTSSSSCEASKNTHCNNPLLGDWSTQPFHFPPFPLIEPSQFPDALDEGMKAHIEDLKAIVNNPEAATFENTVSPYDRSGRLLDRVSNVYLNLCSSKNTDDLKEVQTKMAPLLSRHFSACYMLPGLFERIQQVYNARNEQNLTPEQIRLAERIHLDFEREGAALSEELQKEFSDLKAQLATLTTEFTQNVMKDEETYELVLKRKDLKGCPDSLVEAARMAAAERKKAADEYVITTSRSLVEPFLTFADRRDLRKQIWEAWVTRGEMSPDRNNLQVAKKILKLRKRVAEIHGYPSFAHYQCADRMAKTPESVMELLEDVWIRAKDAANREREAMEEFVRVSEIEMEGGIEAYDWRYIAEKVRKAEYDFDSALLEPYLSLESVREALFGVSNELFGLTYKKRPDIETYHPDVETFEVWETSDGEDRLVSLFISDNFGRPYKTSGAWMSEYRTQTKNLGTNDDIIEGIPIISNNNNFAKSSEHTLLSFDDALTMFHEFGHAHHGMLSDSGYSRLSSVDVLLDFVELPSQLMENWFRHPDILKKYARHYQTGEPVPDELLDKLKAAENFQQGFKSIEYTVCALLDMAVHQVENYDDFDMTEFERSELKRLGMPKGIVMRHRPAHFQHLFSTDTYAAGYYVYLWAEVLDADAFAAFTETGNIFDEQTAARARKFIYGAGNTVAPDELFRNFRGRDPKNEYMLRRKGLIGEES